MYSVKELAEAIGAQAVGDTSLRVAQVREPQDAQKGDLALAMKPEFAQRLCDGAADVAMLWDGADWQSFGLRAAILAPRPRFVLASVSKALTPDYAPTGEVHGSAVIDPSATIGEGASIGPFCVIKAGAVIGANAHIESHVSIGDGAQIGSDALIREGVRVCARAIIGDRVIIQPGAVIGSDGFSFTTKDPAAVEAARKTGVNTGEGGAQSWDRIYSLGSVRIGDDVEIGANCAIDRGTIRDTQIGNGVKLDNLVHVGHNVIVGDDTLLCGQVGVAGSTVIGRNVVLGGQVGVNDNITIGDNVICGGATKVLSNIPSGKMMLGYPAVEMTTHVDMYKALRRLPRFMKKIAAAQKDG